jgi:hypothetical protein
VGAGRYSGFAEAIAQLVQISDTIHPDRKMTDDYRLQLQQYQAVYSSLASVREIWARKVS